MKHKAYQLVKYASRTGMVFAFGFAILNSIIFKDRAFPVLMLIVWLPTLIISVWLARKIYGLDANWTGKLLLSLCLGIIIVGILFYVDAFLNMHVITPSEHANMERLRSEAEQKILLHEPTK